MFTVAKLRTRTAKDLAELARKKKVPGWHGMRKEELVKALSRRLRKASAPQPSTNGCSRTAKSVGRNGKVHHRDAAHGRSRGPQVQRRLQELNARLHASKDLAFRCLADGNGHHVRDRLVVMVRDPYWLHAYWELGRRSVERAEAAMGQYWHGAKPVLRLTEVTRDGTTTSARQFLRDIEIHGGVNNWYIDVHEPPKSYQLEIGYVAIDGKFYALARSNVVSTPPAGAHDSFDKNWAEVAKDFDRIYAMSGGYDEQDGNRELKEVLEERLRRPVGQSGGGRFGISAAGPGERKKAFNLEIDTELIVHGVTQPHARVTLRGEPVAIRPDGSFAVRFHLPDRRHVLPVVASSSDGAEQRTVVLAVDRNTKIMEPVVRDQGE